MTKPPPSPDLEKIIDRLRKGDTGPKLIRDAAHYWKRGAHREDYKEGPAVKWLVPEWEQVAHLTAALDSKPVQRIAGLEAAFQAYLTGLATSQDAGTYVRLRGA